MCGISGILSNGQFDDKRKLVKRMADAISHRGPDGEGYWTNPSHNIAFGHRRLSILDLSENGSQPMHYADGRYTIVFNGEIYNYLEIKSDLLKRGYQFRSTSDTEVILGLYDLKGTDCLQDFNGMFAFAIWDEKNKTLFCARDRFGEKPFFYYHIPGQVFYFASEMKALWSAGVPKEIDEHKMRQFLRGSLLDSRDLSTTFFEGIKQLDGGHYLLIDDLKNVRQKRYYSLEHIERNNTISEAEAATELYNKLEESVRLRLRSDVPVGSSLSGGIDSSTIVKLIDKIKNGSVIQNSFSARFAGYDKDEGHFIKKVVDSCCDISNHEVWPSHEQLIEEIDKLIYHQEEPFTSASIFAQWKVMELAKKHKIKVLLDGQGADEYFAGYLPYYELYVKELYYTRRSFYYTEVDSYNNLRYPEHIRQKPSLRENFGRKRRKLLGQNVPYSEGGLKSRLRNDTLRDGLKVLLRFADRNSMAHSREVRLPFLDHKVVEFVFSLPENFLLRSGWTKWILRQSVSSLLPHEVVWRIDKVGFEPPQSAWLDKILTIQMRKDAADYICDSQLLGKKTPLISVSDWNIYMIAKMIK